MQQLTQPTLAWAACSMIWNQFKGSPLATMNQSFPSYLNSLLCSVILGILQWKSNCQIRPVKREIERSRLSRQSV